MKLKELAQQIPQNEMEFEIIKDNIEQILLNEILHKNGDPIEILADFLRKEEVRPEDIEDYLRKMKKLKEILRPSNEGTISLF